MVDCLGRFLSLMTYSVSGCCNVLFVCVLLGFVGLDTCLTSYYDGCCMVFALWVCGMCSLFCY